MCIVAQMQLTRARSRVALRDRAAIRRAARKTSLKGASRRVIRLYVTRSHPPQCYGNAWELSSEGICVCVRRGTEGRFSLFRSTRVQEESFVFSPSLFFFFSFFFNVLYIVIDRRRVLKTRI